MTVDLKHSSAFICHESFLDARDSRIRCCFYGCAPGRQEEDEGAQKAIL